MLESRLANELRRRVSEAFSSIYPIGPQVSRGLCFALRMTLSMLAEQESEVGSAFPAPPQHRSAQFTSLTSGFQAADLRH